MNIHVAIVKAFKAMLDPNNSLPDTTLNKANCSAFSRVISFDHLLGTHGTARYDNAAVPLFIMTLTC